MKLGGCPAQVFGLGEGRMRIGFAGPIQDFGPGHVTVRFLVRCAARGHTVVGKESRSLTVKCQSGIWASPGQLARYIGGARVVGR